MVDRELQHFGLRRSRVEPWVAVLGGSRRALFLQIRLSLRVLSHTRIRAGMESPIPSSAADGPRHAGSALARLGASRVAQICWLEIREDYPRTYVRP